MQKKMIKQYKQLGKTFYIIKESIIISTIKDVITIGLLLILAYLNYTYIGNSWYIGLFIIIGLFAFIIKYCRKNITKQELEKELKGEIE